jgi:hypothetical protein
MCSIPAVPSRLPVEAIDITALAKTVLIFVFNAQSWILSLRAGTPVSSYRRQFRIRCREKIREMGMK